MSRPVRRRPVRHGPDAVGPRELLGAPIVPPAAVAGAGVRIRAGLGRLHRATAPPPARLFEAALGSLDLAVLATLCRLDLPDRLTSPATCATLAAELELDDRRLERLLRYAATRGWLRLDAHGRVRATRTTAFLRRGHPGGWRAWIEFAAGTEVTAALHALDAGLRADGDAFAAGNGAPFFAWMRQHPERHARFDGAMAAGARMHGLLLAGAVDWSRSRRVCDVGGGDGTLLGVLTTRHPHLTGTVLELPEVAARAPQRDRVAVTGGDAFAAVPADHDTYLLVNVLHDWDDTAATRLLATVATAGPTRVLVVESEAHDRPRDDVATRADLLMLALTPGGRERTTAEMATLAADAGLRRTATHPLASGDVVHVLVPAS